MNHNPETQPLDPFARLASTFRRDIPTFRAEARINRVNDVLCALISLPLAIAVVIWLVRVSDWTLILQNWHLLPLVIALIVLLSRWNFLLITDLGARGGGIYGNVNSSLDSVIRWSAVFVLGPTVLWFVVPVELGLLAMHILKIPAAADRNWRLAQSFTLTIAGLTLAPLVAFSAYTAIYPMFI
ncbi:MAG: hypothetical protein QY332_10490 [Anaerolineales bacterium]|nr:MAG: hypothetical protein QY332_10490 [Anaerolineales bacterium]